MKYTPTYFNFDKLENMWSNIEPFLIVFTIYAIIFTTAWVYNRLSR